MTLTDEKAECMIIFKRELYHAADYFKVKIGPLVWGKDNLVIPIYQLLDYADIESFEHFKKHMRQKREYMIDRYSLVQNVDYV